MSMNGVRPARNTVPWSLASATLGVLTGASGAVTIWAFTSSGGPWEVLALLVVSLGAAAVCTGVPGRRAGSGEATGGGLALAGILMGAIGIVATIGYLVFVVLWVITVYVVVGLLFVASGVELAGAVLGTGL